MVKLTLHERWLLQCLNKLHTGQENPLRFVLLESFKGKPGVWKQIEKDGKAISPAKFIEGRGKKSKVLSDYHDVVRTKSSRGRKPKAQKAGFKEALGACDPRCWGDLKDEARFQYGVLSRFIG